MWEDGVWLHPGGFPARIRGQHRPDREMMLCNRDWRMHVTFSDAAATQNTACRHG